MNVLNFEMRIRDSFIHRGSNSQILWYRDQQLLNLENRNAQGDMQLRFESYGMRSADIAENVWYEVQVEFRDRATNYQNVVVTIHQANGNPIICSHGTIIGDLSNKNGLALGIFSDHERGGRLDIRYLALNDPGLNNFQLNEL